MQISRSSVGDGADLAAILDSSDCETTEESVISDTGVSGDIQEPRK
jgi:hypothetical protein